MGRHPLPTVPSPARLYRHLKGLSQRLAFWSAVVLPLGLLVLLVRGIHTPRQALAFGALVVVNVLAFVGGRGYRRS